MRISTSQFYRDQAAAINKRYEEIGRLMMINERGEKLLLPSDDPVLASRAASITDSISQLKSYEQNEILSTGRVDFFKSSMDITVGATNQIISVIQSAENDTLSDDQRQVLAANLSTYMNVLLGAANTKDSNGDYIYAGFNGDAQPYIVQNGSYQYQGTLDTTSITIGQNVNVLYAESGFTVFGQIPTGNGTFAITGSGSNTGTAYTTPGEIVNPGAYIADTYTLSFVTNGSGQLAYTISGVSSGQVIPPPPATIPTNAPAYINGDDITFNGLTFNVTGTPDVGDSFQIAPSQNQNIFNSLQQLITLLQTPIGSSQTNLAAFHQSLGQLSGTFANAFDNFVDYRAQVGTRAQLIDAQKTANTEMRNNLISIKTNLIGVDETDIISQIAQQRLSLEVTAGTYRLIEETMREMFQSF